MEFLDLKDFFIFFSSLYVPTYVLSPACLLWQSVGWCGGVLAQVRAPSVRGSVLGGVVVY